MALSKYILADIHISSHSQFYSQVVNNIIANALAAHCQLSLTGTYAALQILFKND